MSCTLESRPACCRPRYRGTDVVGHLPPHHRCATRRPVVRCVSRRCFSCRFYDDRAGSARMRRHETAPAASLSDSIPGLTLSGGRRTNSPPPPRPRVASRGLASLSRPAQTPLARGVFSPCEPCSSSTCETGRQQVVGPARPQSLEPSQRRDRSPAEGDNRWLRRPGSRSRFGETLLPPTSRRPCVDVGRPRCEGVCRGRRGGGRPVRPVRRSDGRDGGGGYQV